MKKSLSISVSATINSSTIQDKAHFLAGKLNLPCNLSISETNSDYILAYTDAGLQLVHFLNGQLKPLLFVDFVRGKNGYRHARNLTIQQPLAKAVGIKSGFRPSVLDATAGLGGDSFVLACLGCKVLMYERSNILFSLLDDGLTRAAQEPSTKEIILSRMDLQHRDSIHLLQKSGEKFHTVYLDPMYPHRTKSALNKQEMRVIRDLVGEDEDSDKLLQQALAAAKKRVVVKRPKGAKTLSSTSPSYVVSMKNSRYDIYL